MKELNYKKTGHGHYLITISHDGDLLKATTTNAHAIDAAFDDCYDDVDNSERIYQSREQAQDALISEILTKNNVDA